MKNLYDVLEVDSGVSQDEIRKAYLKMVKKYHPDMNKGNVEYAETKMKEINNAYLIEPDEAILFAFSYSGCMKEGFVLSTSGITYRYSVAHDKVPTFIPYKDITDIYVEKYLLNKVLTIKFDDFTMPDKIFLVGMECIEEFEEVMKEFIIQVQNVRKNPLLIKDILD